MSVVFGTSQHSFCMRLKKLTFFTCIHQLLIDVEIEILTGLKLGGSIIANIIPRTHYLYLLIITIIKIESLTFMKEIPVEKLPAGRIISIVYEIRKI